MSTVLTRTVAAVLAAALVSVGPPAEAALAPGQADPTFGSGGIVRFDPSRAAPTNAFTNDVAVDAQGRILVTGGAADDAGRQALYVARFLPEGGLDPSFGGGGVFLQQLAVAGGSSPRSSGLFVGAAPGGGVLVTADRTRGNEASDVVALRLNAAGRLDLDYGSSGIAALPSTSAFTAGNGSNAVVGADGSLRMVTSRTVSGGTEQQLVIVTPSGATSSTTLQLSDQGGTSAFTYARAIEALPSGQLLVGGGATRGAPRTTSYVGRFSASGELDTTYGGSQRPGVVFQQLGAGSTPSSDVAALANGPGSSVYAASSASVDVSTQAELALTRLGASGQLDGSFGPGGTRRLRLHACDGDGYCGTNPTDLVVDGAGRVLVLMTVWEGTNRHHAVARYLPTGLLDTTFGTDGVASGPTLGLESASAMVPAGAGRLVLAGSDGDRSATAVLRRLTTEPVADPPPAPAVVAADRAAPVLGSPAVTTVRKKRRSTLALTSSEAARLSVTLEQARAGRKAKGDACSSKARTGRACTTYAKVRTVTSAIPAASRAAVALGRLRPGRYRAVLVATDAAGNRSAPVTVAFRVR